MTFMYLCHHFYCSYLISQNGIDAYANSLFSARADPGYVCFLYRSSSSCSGCEACVDSAGWNNMGSVSLLHALWVPHLWKRVQFASVHTFQCFVADAAGCSNASGCTHHWEGCFLIRTHLIVSNQNIFMQGIINILFASNGSPSPKRISTSLKPCTMYLFQLILVFM